MPLRCRRQPPAISQTLRRLHQPRKKKVCICKRLAADKAMGATTAIRGGSLEQIVECDGDDDGEVFVSPRSGQSPSMDVRFPVGEVPEEGADVTSAGAERSGDDYEEDEEEEEERGEGLGKECCRPVYTDGRTRRSVSCPDLGPRRPSGLAMMMGSSSVAFPPEAGSAGMRCSEGIRRGEEIYINKLAMEQDEEDEEEEDEENDDCIRHHHHLHLVPGATTSSSSDAHRPPRMVTATAMGSPDDEPPDENDREDDGDGGGKDDGESLRWADRDASSRGATGGGGDDDAAAVAADDENDDEDDDDEDADDEGGCDANGFGNAALRLSRLRMSMRSISPGRRHSWEPAKKRAVVESKRRSASVDELDSHSEGEEEQEQEVEEEGAQMSTVVAEEHGEEGEDEVEDEEEVERKRRLAKVGGTVAERPQTLEGLSTPFGILHEHHDLSPDGEEARALGLGPMPYRKSAMMPHLQDHEPFINKSRSRSVSYVPSPERRTQSATLPSNMSLSSVMTQADEPGVVSPSKPDGEKAGTRVARTFSFLKNRMTSTKNRNKSKTKEGKEKPPQGGAHRFASATFSSPTHCSHCGKGLGSRDALQCLSCNVCVHRNCSDYLSPCPKHISKSKSSAGGDFHSFSYAGHTHPPQRPLSVSLPADGRLSHGATLGSSSFATSPGANMAGTATLPKSGSSSNLQSSVLEEMDSETEHDSLLQGGEGYIKPSDSPPNEALECDVVDAGGPLRSPDVTDPEGFDVESWSRAVTPTFLKQLEPSTVKRQDVIYELMLTEIHHVRTLHIMSDVFARGMREEAALESGVIDRIFPRLADLRELHEGFLAALCECRRRALEDTGGGGGIGGGGGGGGAQTNGSLTGTGDGKNFVINRIGDLLVQQFSDASAERLVNVYGDFCGRQKEAVSLYKEQLNRKAFQSFVLKQSMNPNTRRLGVPECILLVTQRITKYPVLIAEILKHTKDDPEEHAELSRALVLVKDAVSGVDARCARARAPVLRGDARRLALPEPHQRAPLPAPRPRLARTAPPARGLRPVEDGRRKEQGGLGPVDDGCLNFPSRKGSEIRLRLPGPEGGGAGAAQADCARGGAGGVGDVPHQRLQPGDVQAEPALAGVARCLDPANPLGGRVLHRGYGLCVRRIGGNDSTQTFLRAAARVGPAREQQRGREVANLQRDERGRGCLRHEGAAPCRRHGASQG
ncbi:A-kinase anchor protein 13-like [Lethenteron reissneri]|uniref:A-kinase anchor protein 13-like n=1 Tax=Lethenteron reissneri TaxID=7753 RepID=UPI002AB662D4|nr:A-kinase anchor protein 13-like [Lethenteron reissneri]